MIMRLDTVMKDRLYKSVLTERIGVRRNTVRIWKRRSPLRARTYEGFARSHLRTMLFFRGCMRNNMSMLTYGIAYGRRAWLILIYMFYVRASERTGAGA